MPVSPARLAGISRVVLSKQVVYAITLRVVGIGDESMTDRCQTRLRAVAIDLSRICHLPMARSDNG